MYNDKWPIHKQEVFTTIHDSMIPMDLYQKKKYTINFTTDDTISKFEAFTKKKMDGLYLTEITRT